MTSQTMGFARGMAVGMAAGAVMGVVLKPNSRKRKITKAVKAVGKLADNAANFF